MTLTEFLLARIAEDEADARHAEEQDGADWEWDGSPLGGVGGSPMAPSCDLYADVGAHVARWDPARVLAECEAKRKIIEDFQMCATWSLDGSVAAALQGDAFHWAIQHLATVYKNHPDYSQVTEAFI